MVSALKHYVAVFIIKMGYGIAVVGGLTAVERPARQQPREFGYGNAIELMMKDVVDALLQIGYLLSKTSNQSLCYLAKKHACFAGRIKKLSVFVGED
jgi:hypothetical protein